MEKQLEKAAGHQAAAFFSLVNHPLKLKIYLLRTLPAAFFSGVKVVSANAHTCSASVPFKRFTQNPFRSTYFACLSMAAELTTGVLAMANLYRRQPSASMLITGMEAAFRKKARGLTVFTCEDGEMISEAIDRCLATGQAQEVKAHSIGRNTEGEIVAEFWFNWSFKKK